MEGREKALREVVKGLHRLVSRVVSGASTVVALQMILMRILIFLNGSDVRCETLDSGAIRLI